MNPPNRLLAGYTLLLFILLYSSTAITQTILWEANFDTDPIGFDPSTDWTIGSSQGWEWRSDGRAAGGDYWNDRERIGSSSQGGALVLNYDSLQAIGNTLSFPAMIMSPYISLPPSTGGRIYLKFNQYFRAYNSSTRVELVDLEFFPIASFEVNMNVGINHETSAKDVLVFDITEYYQAGFEGQFAIRFYFEGEQYFWIIDDVQIVEELPLQICDTLWGNFSGQGDFKSGLNDWTSYGVTSPSGTCETVWIWEADSKADAGLNESGDGDIPIASPTTFDGAAVFDADYYDSGGTGEGQGPCPGLTSSILESPKIDLSKSKGPLFLRFNQYFSNEFSETYVGFSTNDGVDWTWLPINKLDGTFLSTSAEDEVVIHLPGAFGTESFKVAFWINADYNFWIIDDVMILEGNITPKPTFPEYVGERLLEYGLPYQVACDSAAYVKCEIVVQFTDDATAADRAALRDTFGVISFRECPCGNIEAWELGPFLPEDPAAGFSANGPSIGIDERAARASAKSKVSGADPNYYNWNELQMALDANPDLFETLSPQDDAVNMLAQIETSDVIIEFLDTGLSFGHPDLAGYPGRNPSGAPPCLDEDLLGWNFVDSTNNPRDNHGHGTHLAGITQKMLDGLGNSCSSNIHFRSQKTHDEHGFAELFHATCAMVNALEKGADVVNASWGWVGDSSTVLSNIIDRAGESGALVVAAAGNDAFDLADHQQYPACYTKDNLITVGAVKQDAETLSDFSNFSPDFVDIMAIGSDVFSTLPLYLDPAGGGIKSGTSMAAPIISGAIAYLKCLNPGLDPASIRERILECSKIVPELSDKVEDGRVIDIPCLIVSTEEPIAQAIELQVWPNPVGNELLLQLSGESIKESQLVIYDALGREVLKKNYGWWQSGEKQALDVGNLAPGLYNIVLQTTEENETILQIKTVRFIRSN